MKLIIENWRRWRDFPSDGHKPLKNPENKEEPQLPLGDDSEEELRGAPIKDRKAISNISSTSEDLLDPATGEIDYDKVFQHIDDGKSTWGPEGDPERDIWPKKRSDAIRDAITALEENPEISPEEEAKLSKFAAEAAAIQRILKRQNPEFHAEMDKIDPHADTENLEDEEETFASPNAKEIETAPDLPYWGPKWRKS